MKITLRGWSRDMGKHPLIEWDLSSIEEANHDPEHWTPCDPTIFQQPTELLIQWQQELRYVGNYRMRIQLSDDDILRLFRTRFGTKLKLSLVEKGFEVSPELTKHIFRTVKLSEVTLDDLFGPHR
jgi:hypothetical protein